MIDDSAHRSSEDIVQAAMPSALLLQNFYLVMTIFLVCEITPEETLTT